MTNILIPNGQLIIVNFPAGAGGKMLQNCLGLSRHCVLGKAEYIHWQLEYTQPISQDFYQQKFKWILQTLPPREQMQNWLAFEIDKNDPYGIGLFDFRKSIPVANQDIYQLAEQGLWSTISVHNYESSKYYINYWPTRRYVDLVNSEMFARKALKIKNTNLKYDQDWKTLGRTPSTKCFEFDVDNCIYDTPLFVKQVADLYKFLDFDDYQPELIAEFHLQYIKLHD
jgi:hypothetical protein